MSDMALLNQSDRTTRPQLNAWLSAFVGWVFDYYEIFLVTFLAVQISQEFDLHPGQTAYFFSLQLAALAIGGVLFGFLADRFGRQRILMWTIVIYSVFTLARAFAPNYEVLLVLTVFAGIGLGGEFGVGQTLVAEVMPARRRGWWSGMLYSGTYVGKTLAVIVGGVVLGAIGWRWVFVVSSVPIVVALIVRFAAPESDVWQRRRQRAPVDWSILRRKAFLVPFALCVFAGVFQFFAFYGVTSFLPTYLIENQGFSFGKTAWWIFLSTIAGFLGCLMGAYTTDRWGRRVTLTYLAGTAAVGGLVLAYTWESLLDSLWILVPFFFHYLGTSAVSVFGALFSEQFPTEVRSTGVSASLQVARGLSFFPPLLTAAIYPVYGYQVIVYVGAALFAALAVIAWLFKEKSGKDVEQVDAETSADGAAPARDVAEEPTR